MFNISSLWVPPCVHHLGDCFRLHRHILYHVSSKLNGGQNKHHMTVINPHFDFAGSLVPLGSHVQSLSVIQSWFPDVQLMLVIVKSV